MADETPSGQIPENANGQTPAAQQEMKTFPADYWHALREENKGYRQQLQSVSGELENLKKLATGNAELEKKLQEASAQLATAQQEADAALRRAALVRLASKAGVSPDVADMLDLSKIDLTDEAKALEQLGKLATTSKSAGGQAKPGTWMNTGLSESELRSEIYGGRKSTIFSPGG